MHLNPLRIFLLAKALSEEHVYNDLILVCSPYMCAYNLLFLSSPRHMCDLTALGITHKVFVHFTCSQMNVPRAFSFPLVLFVFPGQYAILYSIQVKASSFLF